MTEKFGLNFSGIFPTTTVLDFSNLATKRDANLPLEVAIAQVKIKKWGGNGGKIRWK